MREIYIKAYSMEQQYYEIHSNFSPILDLLGLMVNMVIQLLTKRNSIYIRIF